MVMHTTVQLKFSNIRAALQHIQSTRLAAAGIAGNQLKSPVTIETPPTAAELKMLTHQPTQFALQIKPATGTINLHFGEKRSGVAITDLKTEDNIAISLNHPESMPYHIFENALKDPIPWGVLPGYFYFAQSFIAHVKNLTNEDGRVLLTPKGLNIHLISRGTALPYLYRFHTQAPLWACIDQYVQYITNDFFLSLDNRDAGNRVVESFSIIGLPRLGAINAPSQLDVFTWEDFNLLLSAFFHNNPIEAFSNGPYWHTFFTHGLA